MAQKPKPNPKEVRKGCTFLIVIVSIPILCFYIFCGETNDTSGSKPIYSHEDTLRAITSVLHETVELYLKENLHDAGSYQSVLWGEPIPMLAGNYIIRHKYRARNPLGAYMINDQFFTIDGRGVVINVEPFD